MLNEFNRIRTLLTFTYLLEDTDITTKKCLSHTMS